MKITPKALTILMVADVSISKVIGGAERALFENSVRLADLGHDVHILTRRLPWHESDHETVHGVKEWRFDFNESNFLTSLYTTTFNSKALFEDLTSKVAFDVINFHQPFSALGVVASKKSENIRKVYTCHSLSFEEFISRNPKPNNLAGKLLYNVNRKLRWTLEKRVLDRSDKVVVLSDYTKEKLNRHYLMPDEKICIVPGGVDLKRFSPGGDRQALREKFAIPQDSFVLFTVRNLVARMGLENLLAAMGKVAANFPELYLVIGGRGPLLESLQELTRKFSIEKQVHFPGFIKEEDLPDYYRLADMFVLATKELEGFGLVTVEALASGLPVLGTPIGGTKEILSKLDPALLFDEANSDAMALTIEMWRKKYNDNPELHQKLSGQCRTFAETNYSWDDKIDQLEKVFSAL